MEESIKTPQPVETAKSTEPTNFSTETVGYQNKPVSFVGDHFDKLLLALLIGFTYAGFMVMVHWAVAAEVLAFATATVSGLTGALVALLTNKK
jgi:hypothetical protein